MNADKFPPVSQPLLKRLNETFPLMETLKHDTHDDIMWKAAQRSVITFLTRIAEEQTGQF